MFRPQCGKEIPDESKCCFSCGYSLEAISTRTGPPSDSPSSPGDPAAQVQELPTEESKRQPIGAKDMVEPSQGVPCPKCGLTNPPSAQRCDCGYDFYSGQVVKSPESAALPAAHSGALPANPRMATHVKVLAYISLAVALIFALGALAALVPHSPTHGIYLPRAFNSPDPATAGFAAIFFILPLLCVFAGLIRFKSWGRNISLALAALLLVVPISWYALWVLTRPESKALFGVVPRPANQPRGCLATGAYIVGAIIVIIFNMGIVSAIFKHPTNRLHPISDITTGTGSSTGYCGMDASGKIISAEMVSARGMVTATNPGARAYMLVDGPSLEDGIAVVVNKQFPIPAGDATLEVMAFVQCSSSLKSRLIEVARFAWNVSPDEKKVASAKGAMWMLAISLEAYKRDTGSFPSTMQGLKALRERPNGVRLWHGPYGETPKDPWGNDYVYRCPGEHGDAPDLISLGADGLPGGIGVNADIVGWRHY